MNYGDLVSEKEFKKYIKEHPEVETITVSSEHKAKLVYEEELWRNVEPGKKVQVYWKEPDIIDGEHSMIWKRHFYGEVTNQGG